MENNTHTMYRLTLSGLFMGLLLCLLSSCQSTPDTEEYVCEVNPDDLVIVRIGTLLDSLDISGLQNLLDSTQELGDYNLAGEVLYNIGRAHSKQGDIPGKLHFYGLALKEFERGQPLVLQRLARMSINVAGGYLSEPGKQDSLIMVTKQAINSLLPFAGCAKTDDLLVELYHYLGVGLRNMGDYDAALYYLSQGKKLCEESPKTFWRCARLSTELARVQNELVHLDSADASALYSESLLLANTSGNRDKYLADNYDTKVDIAKTRKDTVKLLGAAKLSLYYNRLTRPLSPFMGHSYNNLALAKIFMGDYPEAKSLLDSAMAIYSLNEVAIDQGSCYENYASIFLARGDMTAGLAYLDSAEVAYHGDPALPAIVHAIDQKELKDPLLERAELTLLLHTSHPREFPLNEVYYRVARVDSIFSLLQQRVGSEQSKRQNIKQLRIFYEKVVAFGFDQWQRSEDSAYLDFSQAYLERSKGRILRERRRNTFAGLDKDGGRANDVIFAARSRLAGLQGKLRNAEENERPALRQQIAQAQLALRDKVDQGNKLSDSIFLGTGEITRLVSLAETLQPGQVVLDYLLGKEESYLSYATATDRGLLKLPASTKDITTAVNVLKQSLEARGTTAWNNDVSFRKRELTNYRESAQRLYRLLLYPVLALAPEVEHVTVIPDGPINFVPFGALLREAPSDPTEASLGEWPFALRSLTFNYEFSADLWADRNQRTYTGGQQTLLVSPVQEKPREFKAIGFDRPQTLSELSLTEATALGKVTNATSLEGAQAGRLRDNIDLSPFGILHFTGHGLASVTDPYRSVLVLEVGPGGNHKLLSLSDLEALPLNLQLLVLSACQTGVGEVATEEGVICLGRAGAIAGARSVVTSLWYVNQAAKADLFKRFYQQLAEGVPRDHAIRTAQLGQLASGDVFSHPYFWASFLHTGDPAPLASNFFTGARPTPSVEQ